ncbi:protein eva-1 homolog C-like [Pomacea canaliculata]|uniref:protein eva-1 homolog C-like n=1 Tax=Pomacea canaliculata TaxID=400727 RepID=UPI000D72ED6C|nr:protein eva-1 homolog C-like [Pomacea canaliculata]
MRWAGGGSSITSYFSSRCLAGRQGEISVLSTVWITVLALMLGHCVRPCFQFVGFHGGSLTRTLQTLQQYTCEGKTMLISCPASTVISVQYAKFGRSVPSARMCPAGDTLTSPALMSEVMLAPGYRVTAAEDTNCLAIRSLEVLLELCEHQPRCQVRAESTTFRQDPCPATSKYLEVHYKCRPNDFQRQTVCEGEQMEIGCGKALRIAVYSAMFGRAPNGSVSCPSDRPGYFDCQAAETVSEVRGACQGRKRCDLLASEAVFGNPCAAGIKKYLAVTYACVPKRILKELHRHKGHLKARHNKKRGKKKAQEVEGKAYQLQMEQIWK